jgi:hypothetical protein
MGRVFRSQVVSYALGREAAFRVSPFVSADPGRHDDVTRDHGMLSSKELSAVGQAFQPVILWTGRELTRAYGENREKERGRLPSLPGLPHSNQTVSDRSIPGNRLNAASPAGILPHLQAPESTYFVIFRCCTGLFLPDPAKEIVISTIRHWDGLRFDLDDAVAMSEHVPLIFRIPGGLSLTQSCIASRAIPPVC